MASNAMREALARYRATSPSGSNGIFFSSSRCSRANNTAVLLQRDTIQTRNGHGALDHISAAYRTVCALFTQYCGAAPAYRESSVRVQIILPWLRRSRNRCAGRNSDHQINNKQRKVRRPKMEPWIVSASGEKEGISASFMLV